MTPTTRPVFFFLQQMQKILNLLILEVVLKSESLLNNLIHYNHLSWNIVYGKKRDTTKVVHFKDRIQAVHLQCEGKHTTITAKVIKAILLSPIFQQRYKCNVRLISEFDRNSGPYIQEKIKRCITQHSQFCNVCLVTLAKE